MPDPVAYTDADLDIATITLFGECRGEPLEGQQAVAWVIRNRAAWQPSAWWGSGIAEVCRKPHQFSCWNYNSPELSAMANLAKDDPTYLALAAVAKSVFDDAVDDPTKGSTSYQRVGTGAAWSKGRPIAAIIGHHEFYRIKPDGA